MTYFTGAVAAVPTANKAAYQQHVAAVWPLFQTYGASRMVESWGADVPKGKVTDFQGAVQAKEDESIVFSWLHARHAVRRQPHGLWWVRADLRGGR